MTTKNEDPNTTVPRDEGAAEEETETGGRSTEPNTTVPRDEDQTETTVPRDNA